ncbi:protein sidekick-1 [Gadus chalcogrammus]|uniref:protein sidekick-1 n=1 Tax=Gadus chalcogrammus TaxID=1042646 RepID=UPI0024C20C55|nr:protein sidekick-1 [Gadus chalcogrammus]
MAKWILIEEISQSGKKNRGSTESDTELVSPAIVIGPRNTTVVAGREVTLECIANGRPVDRLVLSWRREGRWLAGGRRLVIPAPVLADSGVYVCEALLSNSTLRTAEARAHLTVMEGPSFTSLPKRKTLAELDKNVEIPCLVTGTPQPRMEWFKDAVPLSRLANPRYKVAAATGLTVRRVQPEDGGIYQCVARSAAGEVQAHTHLQVSSVAPAFISPPTHQAVTEGNAALFTCQASGAPKPAIVWSKGSQVLASGSVRTPRYFLLESGGLQVQPVGSQDSGEYTCIASNPQGSINATAGLTVWSRTLISVPPSDQRVIKGTTATLDCNAQHDPRVDISFQWHRSGTLVRPSSGGRVSVRQGSLTIGQTWSGDIGDYTCTVTSRAGNDSRSARLEVIELPHSPRSLAAQLNDSDSRSVHLSWLRPFDGNSPLLHYLLELSENNSPWKVYLPEVDPAVNKVLVGGLTPARTYQFRLCAVNQVGRGQYSAETQRLMLREEAPSAPPKNIVASGRTNQSIMVQWQPPPEPQLNGVLRGYVLRYRLAGLPGDYQEKNISSPETNYCLLSDLIIWTQYQIQVAAYTGAGLGDYSSAVTEYTLQGVPTAPPQDVNVLAVNSTTIRFTWNPPPQQFINGINQGYKLLVWPERSPEEITIVTITPEYPGSRHTGLVSGLRKFTRYFGSALCFTTPGDGPRSPPTLLQTHEDAPGPVSSLSFPEVLDTSVRVSWEQPADRNGIITGYVLWWEVTGVNSSRLERSLSNATLQHQLTGLTSVTSYTILVAARTVAGPGQTTASTVSTGVPPELPGAPSNLVISNISPRSVTISFRPGSDGKTAKSQWVVEGQVVEMDGEEVAWKVVYQIQHVPGTQLLEIPDLTPFTQYRFRMRQANIVGSSPLSGPSRLIQTLQAAPDTPPSNLTLLAATQTSLRVRWKPLLDHQYNGSPDAVGYRLRVRRADGAGKEKLEETSSSSSSREASLEGLEPWTQYLVQIQAFNSIGAGPWSSGVAAHTAESVPSGAPVNVSAEAVSSTKILLKWAAVLGSQKNGVILGYKVLCAEKDSIAPPSVSVVVGERSGTLLFGVLEKYTLYALQVLAYTRLGDGPPSSPVLTRTKEDVPGPPARMVFPEVRLTSVRVVWQPPSNPNGIILGYQISYRLESADPQRWTTVEVGSNARQFTVTGLSPQQNYLFRLTGRTALGWGETQEGLVITTERRERPQAPRKLSIPQEEVESRKLRLHWVTGSAGSSPLRYFTLQMKELPSGEWSTHTADIPHNLSSWTADSWQRWLKVQDLTRGVTYAFSVQARTVALGPPLQANISAQPLQGTPGSPMGMSITKSSSSLALHWTEGEAGVGPISGYVVEARPSDEGVWDSFIRLLPPSSRSASVPMERLRSGISYEFRVIAINRYGYGEPSSPSTALAALSERPFYEEWWFLLVMALISLILILVLVFTLLLHGHGTKYKACSTGKHLSTVEESVTLDNGGFTALELNSRTLNSKNSFLKKNGTRSPPRPSPGGLHYSDEDICNNYNGAVLTESTTLTEKPNEVSESELTDSDYEDEQPKHSFVNHYMSDPTYYNSWKRQPKGLKGTPGPAGGPFAYEDCVVAAAVAAAAVAAGAGDGEPYYQTVVTQHSAGGAYTPTGQPALTHVNPNTNPPGSRTPLTGFSSFV